MNKPNCYNCIYRGEVPGDAHSSCHHPYIEANGGAFMEMAIAASGRMMGKNSSAAHKLKIIGNAHGIRSGWFMWPANFDPCWLENCDGFKDENDKTN